MIQENYASLLKAHFSFWDNLTKQEQELLFETSVIKHYSKGSSVYNGSDDCLGMLLVKKGQLRIYVLSDDGREVTLFRLFENDVCVLSASCVIESVTFDVLINAEDDTDLLVLNSSVYNELKEKNVYVENFTHKLTTTRFSDVMWTMEQILFMGADKRLAIFLIDESSKNKSNEIHMTHEQIARLMGSAREVITRMLKYFVSEGIVTLTRGCIHIIDKQKLRSLTQ